VIALLIGWGVTTTPVTACPQDILECADRLLVESVPEEAVRIHLEERCQRRVIMVERTIFEVRYELVVPLRRWLQGYVEFKFEEDGALIRKRRDFCDVDVCLEWTDPCHMPVSATDAVVIGQELGFESAGIDDVRLCGSGSDGPYAWQIRRITRIDARSDWYLRIDVDAETGEVLLNEEALHLH
jgi:hypothetical protein